MSASRPMASLASAASPSVATAVAEARSNAPANTATRRNTARSSSSSRSWLQSITARNDRCRPVAPSWSAERPSRRSRSSRPVRSPSTPSEATRAAASSMARGMPSSRPQISPTSEGSVSRSAPPVAARSTNSTGASSPSGGTATTRSPPTPRRSRLVASTTSSGQSARAVSTQRRGVVQDVLAVVEDDQRRPTAERLADDDLERGLGLVDHVEGGGHCRHQAAAVDRDEVDERPSTREGRGEALRGRHGQPGLADAPRAHQRDHPVLADRGRHLGQVVDPADEARPRRRQAPERAGGAVGRALRGSRRRGQRPPVGHVELAQEGGDVALHRPDRDVQALGDLGVGQVLADGSQDLGLPRRDPFVADRRHGAIFTSPRPLRGGSVVDPWWFRGPHGCGNARRSASSEP